MNITFNLELNSSNSSKGVKTILIRCTQNRKHKRITDLQSPELHRLQSDMRELAKMSRQFSSSSPQISLMNSSATKRL